MNDQKASVTEYSQVEAMAYMKEMLRRYPPENPDSADIIINTLENVTVLLLVSVKDQIKPKPFLHKFSKSVREKFKFYMANMEAHLKNLEVPHLSHENNTPKV
jgi:hypothetical protein